MTKDMKAYAYVYIFLEGLHCLVSVLRGGDVWALAKKAQRSVAFCFALMSTNGPN